MYTVHDTHGTQREREREYTVRQRVHGTWRSVHRETETSLKAKRSGNFDAPGQWAGATVVGSDRCHGGEASSRGEIKFRCSGFRPRRRDGIAVLSAPPRRQIGCAKPIIFQINTRYLQSAPADKRDFHGTLERFASYQLYVLLLCMYNASRAVNNFVNLSEENENEVERFAMKKEIVFFC